jgi:CheY-like chemotaxis protein
MGDPLRLKQVLINLCSNAIKFTAKGYVRVHVKLVQKTSASVHLQFEVQDTGIGISKENQAKLFSSFAQAEVSTARKFGGTGLGLAISKNLVQMMGGEIGLESEEGKGATFHFNVALGLPETNADNAEKKAKKEDSTFHFTKLKILLAEDNVINQKVAILNLQKLGHEVLVVSDGLQALEIYKKEMPDLVFMDVKMPIMDGTEATIKIREFEKDNKILKKVPVVAMTANSQKSDKIEYIAAGMDDYLSKPFNINDLEQLFERIRKQLEDRIK